MTIEIKLLIGLGTLVLSFAGWVLNEKLKRSKLGFKYQLTYFIKGYKLFRKSDKDVEELEALKEKILQILKEDK